MGWKNIKEHYRIKHIVCVTEKGICIGSGYVHDILVIGADGTVANPHEFGNGNEDLVRYRSEMQADPAKLRQLIETPDTFARSITVFTYDYNGHIIEKQCEELGWPNVTHDGAIMYENTFSADRAQVVEWAKENTAAAVENWRGILSDREQHVADARQRLAGYQAALARLSASG
jgi:hypothetical protein